MRRDDVDTTWIELLIVLLILGIIVFLLLIWGHAGGAADPECPR